MDKVLGQESITSGLQRCLTWSEHKSHILGETFGEGGCVREQRLESIYTKQLWKKLMTVAAPGKWTQVTGRQNWEKTNFYSVFPFEYFEFCMYSDEQMLNKKLVRNGTGQKGEPSVVCYGG